MLPIRVLIAICNKRFLASYCDFLAQDGFEVTAATDGLWCMGLLRAFVPDVLVLDRDLPWGGGDGVATWMREEDRLARVPIVTLTTQSALTRPASPTFAADLHLSSAPAPDMLARTIRRLLSCRCDPRETNDDADAYARTQDAVADGEFDDQLWLAGRSEDLAL